VHTQSIDLDQRLSTLKISHLFEDYGPGAHDWPYWQRDLRKTMPDIMRAFADPPKAPAAVTFTAVEPKYAVFGWRGLAQPLRARVQPPRERDRTGLPAGGQRRRDRRHPPLYAPGSEHGVTAGTKDRDAHGRRRRAPDGPGRPRGGSRAAGGPAPRRSVSRVQDGRGERGRVAHAAAGAAAPACADRLTPRAVARVRGARLAGTAHDRGCSGLARVEVSVARRVHGRCRFLDARGRLGRARPCARRSYLLARGADRWTLPVRLPRGGWPSSCGATDLAGNVVRAFSTSSRTRA